VFVGNQMGAELMNLSLEPGVQKPIDERVNSGKYSTAEEVVAAAIIALDQLEHFGDFEASELDSFLAEGEQTTERDGTLDGGQAHRARVQRRAQRRELLQ
jgi:Arc/MetJ-type ribon-helix-helix transcriptional regulator